MQKTKMSTKYSGLQWERGCYFFSYSAVLYSVEQPLINAFYSFCLFVIFRHRLSLKSEKGISILRDSLAARCQDDLDV